MPQPTQVEKNINTIAPVKRSFILRWGNLLLFVISFICFFIGFATLGQGTTSYSQESVSTRQLFGTVYLIGTGLIFIMSIVRLFKKYHIGRSILWILLSLIMAFLAPGLLASSVR